LSFLRALFVAGGVIAVKASPALFKGKFTPYALAQALSLLGAYLWDTRLRISLVIYCCCVILWRCFSAFFGRHFLSSWHFAIGRHFLAFGWGLFAGFRVCFRRHVFAGSWVGFVRRDFLVGSWFFVDRLLVGRNLIARRDFFVLWDSGIRSRVRVILNRWRIGYRARARLLVWRAPGAQQCYERSNNKQRQSIAFQLKASLLKSVF
jgi:hypothetical protein